MPCHHDPPPGLAGSSGRPLLGGLTAVVAVLLLAVAPPAEARARRISLSVPSSVNVGARVVATGTLARRSRGRRVSIQRLRGRRWSTLHTGAVAHRKFRVVFTAPNVPGILTVRAVLYRHGRRVGISRSRRLVIRARAQGPSTVPLSTAPPLASGLGTTIAAWGENSHWELGAGYKSAHSVGPVSVRGLSGIKSVAATYFSSYALLNDGTVRSWGGNLWGQLGDGTHGEESPTPVPVSGLTGVTAIAVGGAHAMALLGNGTVATWGGNTYGQMGNGTTLKGVEGMGSDVPVLVPGLTGVVAIAAGGADDVALLSNGTVVAWGENKQGQLGDGTTVEKDVPTPVRGLASVRAIAIGGVSSLGGHMLALLNDGTVRAVGGNPSGQLGNGTTTASSSPVTVTGLGGATAVSAALSHSVALLANGDVVAWGSNDDGELGASSGPEQCGSSPTACSKVPVRVGLANVTGISAGFRFSLALSGGKVFAWGLNELGQLGNGTTANSSLPTPVSDLSGVVAIAAGEKHSLALLQASGPATLIEVAAGAGSLTVSWKSGEEPEPWSVAWRPVTHPPENFGQAVSLPPATRSYTISGLSARPYEVVVKNKTFGQKIVTGTPLG
ncbi:MAG: repeat-containing protein [Solirubrobacterales bacterium]|nr:repeat-containing protein [Solirubrobacterales bacterium]MCW3025059.1 repeat-containing protein [Solirubrobacterales bacterium]